MSFSRAVIIISHVPIVVTAIYGALIYRKLGRELKTFCFFLFLSAGLQLISLVLWFNKLNNMALLHVLVAFGFLSLAFFYSTVLEGFINKRIIYGTAISFFAFSVINSLFIQPVNTFNSYALTAESFLVVVFSLFTYTCLLNEVVKEKRKDIISFNWINSGLFIYYSSNLLIFYFGELITKVFTDNLSRHVWILHSLFSIIMYVCFFTGIWKRSKS